jgi:iron complex outermembrane recepter protein
MRLRVRGRSRVIEVLLIAALAVARTIPAFATETHEFYIPSEDAPAAIRDFATQAHVQILVAGENVKEKHLHPVSGEFSTDQGLRMLLADSGLTPQYVGDRSIALVTASASTPVPQGNAKEEKKSSSEEFRVAQLAQRTNSQSSDTVKTETTASLNQESILNEVVVTAQKYNSTVQATPISISAVTGEQLAAAGITNVEDFSRTVPGLSMRTAGPGYTEYEARGLASNGGAAPTVGFYLDETPLSPPALAQVGKVVIDPDLYDINRIELLRGPQGTLYGASSMGGTVKIVTNAPQLGKFEGSVQGTASGTEGGGPNGSGKFAVNIPIGDQLAIRFVGSETWRSGWIDRIVLDPFPVGTPLASGPPWTRGNVLAAPIAAKYNDVNTENLGGGRVSVLWQPSEGLSIVAMSLFQRMQMGGPDYFDSPPGSNYLAHYEAADIREPIDDRVYVNSLKVTADLGFAELTSATGYWWRRASLTEDASESTSWVFGIAPYVGVPWTETDYSHQLSQELRITSKEGSRLRWTFGGFFSELDSRWTEDAAGNFFAAPQNPSGLVGAVNNPYEVQQYALFTDDSYKITDNLTFTAGLRWYRYLSRQLEQEWGVIAGVLTPPPATETEGANNGFNPRFDLSYSPTHSLTTYASISKGFRPGGANEIIPPPTVPPYCPSAPLTFGPDSVWDYEVGEKARLFDGRLTVNSDLYYIKWLGVQEALLLPCGYQFNANAGNGRSFGPEVEINAKLAERWLLTLSGSYTDAKVTHPSTQLIGDVLGTVSSCQTATNCSVPILNVPKDAASIAIAYVAPVFKEWNLTARISDSFVGTAYDESYVFGLKLPSYNIAGLRFGLSNQSLTATLFVDNLTNTVAAMTANNTSFQVNVPTLVRYSTNQPRTAGLQLDYRF